MLAGSKNAWKPLRKERSGEEGNIGASSLLREEDPEEPPGCVRAFIPVEVAWNGQTKIC